MTFSLRITSMAEERAAPDIRIFALKTPSSPVPSCRSSMTMPAARPSGKGICSSLMKRFFKGKAKSTPRMERATSQAMVWNMGMTWLVMSM